MGESMSLTAAMSIVAEMRAIRATAQQLTGRKYPAKVAVHVALIKKLMGEWNCSAIETLQRLLRETSPTDDGEQATSAILWLTAATVEIVEAERR